MKVLNFGSLNIDNVYSVDHIVIGGETEQTGSMSVFPGGKGLNQSIALARAGITVDHAGLIGEEGSLLIDVCRKSGVNADLIRTIPGKSGHTIIQVDKEGQNSILLFGGANMRQSKEYVDSVLDHFEKGDIILLQNEINEIDYLIDAAYKRGMFIILNPSPYNERLSGCDFKKVSMFFINEIEGGQISGKEHADDILAEMRSRYPSARVVLTLGGAGSVYQDEKETVRQPIYKVDVVDTTAAGDTFTGFFISSMVRGMSTAEGMKMAARAAAIAVSRNGAAPSIPTYGEVTAAIAE